MNALRRCVYVPLACAALPLAAAEYSGSININGAPPWSATDAVSVSHDAALPGLAANGTSWSLVQGAVRSGPGSVGSSLRTELNNTGVSGSDAALFPQGNSEARAKTRDLTFTGGSGSLLTSLNVDFNGANDGSFFAAPGSFSGGANANVTIELRVLSFDGSTTYLSASGSHQVSWSGSGTRDSFSSGLLSGYSGTGPVTLTTGAFSVPYNTPLTLDLRVLSAANISAYWGISGDVYSSFAHTLTLAKLGPVFSSLPSGSNVDSAEFNLSANSFTPVPEPSAWAAIASLAAGLAAWARRRRG